MRCLVELARVRSNDDSLEDDEIEALGRLEILSDLRPTWVPEFYPALLTMRVSPAAALLAASASSEHLGVVRQSWSAWARPWGLRGLSSLEVWRVTMEEAIEAGLMAGELPKGLGYRSASEARLGPRLLNMIDGGAKRVRVAL